jgi:hypothetical protein
MRLALATLAWKVAAQLTSASANRWSLEEK